MRIWNSCFANLRLLDSNASTVNESWEKADINADTAPILFEIVGINAVRGVEVDSALGGRNVDSMIRGGRD